jgi:hypothetical protein
MECWFLGSTCALDNVAMGTSIWDSECILLCSCCERCRILPGTWEDCAGAMEAEHPLEVCVPCADPFESLGSGINVMADDVLISAAKSKRESRAFMLEAEHRNGQVL